MLHFAFLNLKWPSYPHERFHKLDREEPGKRMRSSSSPYHHWWHGSQWLKVRITIYLLFDQPEVQWCSKDSSKMMPWPNSSRLRASVLLELEERRKDDGFICSWLPGLELLKRFYFWVKSSSLNCLGMQSQASDNIDMNALSRTKWGFATLLLSRVFLLKSLRVFNFYKVIIFKVIRVQFLLLETSCCRRNGILLQIT